MRKSLILFFLSVLAMVFLGYGVGNTARAADEDSALVGKVYVHYMSWEAEEKEVGIHVWDNGTDAQAVSPPYKYTGKDDFGYVMEVNVMSDASDNIGIIVIKDNVLSDPWNNKDSADMFVNVKPLKEGITDRIDVYYFSGGVTEYFVADPEMANVFALYYDPSGSYEDKLGVHAWGFEDLDSEWGTPREIFKDGFKSPGDTQGKVAHMKYTPGDDKDPGFLIYAGSDANKKHAAFGDIKEETVPGFSKLKAGEIMVIFVTGGNVFAGVDKKGEFIEGAFTFGFQEFQISSLAGTFAKNPTTIFARFTLKMKTKKVVGKEEITVIEHVRDNPVFVPSDDGWKLPDDLPEFDEYEPADLPDGAEAKVVFHYQRWDGDYTGTGLWTWNCGTAGSSGAVTMKGVDDFGAVMEIVIDTDDAEDTIGIIPIAHDIDKDSRWDHRETPVGEDINLDISKLNDGTLTELHVYYFEGGLQNVFIADATKANVLILYYDPEGNYEENLGFHTWGDQWTNVENASWGEPVKVFVDGFKSPLGVTGKAALLQTEPGTDAETLIYAGDDETKKHADHGNLKGFEDMVAGEVRVVYVAMQKVYDERTEFAPEAFGGTIIWEPVFEEVTKEIDILELIDFKEYFTLKEGDKEIPIKAIYFNTTAEETNEFVLELDKENKLDNKKKYTLYFDNQGEGNEHYQVEIELDLDTQAPVITLVTEDDVDEVIITIPLGSEWDNSLFPIYRASDDRDKNLSSKVYVPEDKGFLSTKKAGTYEITLQVEDEWGNVGTATFKIVVAPRKGCKNKSANIFLGLGVLGLGLFLIRRRRFVWGKE